MLGAQDLILQDCFVVLNASQNGSHSLFDWVAICRFMFTIFNDSSWLTLSLSAFVVLFLWRCFQRARLEYRQATGALETQRQPQARMSSKPCLLHIGPLMAIVQTTQTMVNLSSAAFPSLLLTLLCMASLMGVPDAGAYETVSIRKQYRTLIQKSAEPACIGEWGMQEIHGY